MRRLVYLIVCFLALGQGVAGATTITFTPNTDITSELQAAINAGQGGYGPDQAMITLPAGSFFISNTIDLHMSTLQGSPNNTCIRTSSDFGTGKVAFTSDPGQAHPCEIDDLTIEGPIPSGTIPVGDIPSNMCGVHLYDDCVLRRVVVQYFNTGVIIDGNHHVLDTVTAQKNYYGVSYVVSSDGTYYDDYLVDCNMTSNQMAGIYVAPGATMGGSTMLRTHTGIEPYSFLLGHDGTIADCQFLQTQFEGVGNADIADTDGTSVISANFFAECCGWGGEYNVAIAGQPTSPVIRVGYFMNNVIEGGGGGSGDDDGPPAGDMSVVGGCESNSWTCANSLISTIANGQLTPITCTAPGGVTGNRITSEGMTIGLFDASSPVKAGQAVEIAPSHYLLVGPASGRGSVLGISLGNVLAGQAAWIVQQGITTVPCDPGVAPTCGGWLEVDPATGLGMIAPSATSGETIGLVVNADVTPPQVRISF